MANGQTQTGMCVCVYIFPNKRKLRLNGYHTGNHTEIDITLQFTMLPLENDILVNAIVWDLIG